MLQTSKPTANSKNDSHSADLRRVRQVRVLGAAPGRPTARRHRLGPRLPVLSSVYHAKSIVVVAYWPRRIEGSGPHERPRRQGRACRTGSERPARGNGIWIREVVVLLWRVVTERLQAILMCAT